MNEMHMKKGFTRIPNDILEALCALNASGSEMRILLYIIRRTYGFNRDFAEISLSEISSAVGMDTAAISKVLKKLEGRKLIERRPAKGIRPQTISISEEGFLCQNEQLSETTTVVDSDNSGIDENNNPAVVKNDNAVVVDTDNHTYKEIKEDNKERERKAHGTYGFVLLSDDEFKELTDDYGESNTRDYIRKVDTHVKATGRPYSDYAAVIRKWMEDDKVKKDDFDMSKYAEFINRF